MADPVASFLGSNLSREISKVDSFFDRYGLDKNPFPPNRMIVSEVLFDQEAAFQRFRSLAHEVLESTSPERRALAVVAGTGGGKTHFLRHCQFIFRAALKKLDRGFAVVDFAAGSGKVDDMIRMIYESCDETCRQRHESDLPTAIARTLAARKHEDELNDILATITMEDVGMSLRRLVEATRENFEPRDQRGQFGFDGLRDVFGRWVRGGSITQTEKKYLGVYSRISSASVATRVLRELLTLARRLSVLEGVLLCLDEVESLFTRGLNLGKIQAFLQDLRFFFDEAVKSTSGYNLLVLSASTTTGAETLKERSYAVYQRLTYEGQNRVSLEPIRLVTEAQRFAYAYIDHFHNLWIENRGRSQAGQTDPHSLLSLQEIEAAFREASGGAQTAPQGQLLDVFHRRVTERRAKEIA